VKSSQIPLTLLPPLLPLKLEKYKDGVSNCKYKNIMSIFFFYILFYLLFYLLFYSLYHIHNALFTAPHIPPPPFFGGTLAMVLGAPLLTSKETLLVGLTTGALYTGSTTDSGSIPTADPNPKDTPLNGALVGLNMDMLVGAMVVRPDQDTSDAPNGPSLLLLGNDVASPLRS
jgi:hypothetical protein